MRPMVFAYRVKEDITCGKNNLSGDYIASTTWVRRNGKWLAQIHTETPTTKPDEQRPESQKTILVTPHAQP